MRSAALALALAVSLAGVTSLPAIACASTRWADNQLTLSFYDNRFFTANVPVPPAPLFWQATRKATSGGILYYQRVIFHTDEHFSFHLGASVDHWMAASELVYGVSAMMAARVWFVRTDIISPYFVYSIAGPTFLSRQTLGTTDLGARFIFQDIIGFGAQIGDAPTVGVEVTVMHYSNGYVFPVNSGFDVPIVFSMSLVF